MKSFFALLVIFTIFVFQTKEVSGMILTHSMYVTGVTMRYIFYKKSNWKNAIAIPKKMEFCGKMSKLDFVVITLIQKNLETPLSFHSLKNVVCTSMYNSVDSLSFPIRIK